MARSIHATLDKAGEKALTTLTTQLGCTEDEAIREALKFLSRCAVKPAAKRILGLGQFSSGISDLGSNKKHLKGLGR